jgi:hypothetical protein
MNQQFNLSFLNLYLYLLKVSHVFFDSLNLAIVKLGFGVKHFDDGEDDEANSKVEVDSVFHLAELNLIGTQIESIPHHLIVFVHIELSAHSIA